MFNDFGLGSDYGYGATNTLISPSVNSAMGATVWTIVSLILALIGCFVIYFLFVIKKGDNKQKFLTWLRDFLSFKTMLIEPILKISYLFFAIFITLGSFALIGTNFLSFLLTLIIGNIVLRITYEALLIMIMIWKNTTDINKKMK